MSNSTNNKRIAKNTALLYMRTLFNMFVSLYTSRIILRELGVEDFGIYNVVGGVVAMFAILNSSMANGFQRFINFELGRGNQDNLVRVFKTSLTIQTIIAFAVLLLGETIGLWFLNTQMTIPLERLDAANWVYQLSLLSFVVIIYQAPFTAVIIAHERMDYYALIGVFEVFLKLGAVLLLKYIGFDKLVVYALFIFFISIAIKLMNLFYCRFKFDEVRLGLTWDREMLQSMLGFSGWNLFGSTAHTMKGQGINILLNLFFGTAVNASRGIAFQVLAAVTSFVGNFQTAVKPQMIGAYARGEMDYFLNLIYSTSKYYYFLLLVLSLPILIEAEQLLAFWLGDAVPEYAVVFTRLAIVTALIETFANPITTAVHAVGKLKKFQVICSSVILSIIPLSYLILQYEQSPLIPMIVSIVVCIIVQFVRLYLIKSLIPLSYSVYLYRVVYPCFIVTIAAFSIPFILVVNMDMGLLRLLLVGLMSLITSTLSIYLLGLEQFERDYVIHFLSKIKYKI